MILVFTIAVGYFFVVVAHMVNNNTVKRKNQKQEEAITAKEQEKVSILLEQQNEKQQAFQQNKFEWSDKIKILHKEKQKTILGSTAYSLAEHDLIYPTPITIQSIEMYSLQELMYYVYSVSFNVDKKCSDIVNFLFWGFRAYFSTGKSSISKNKLNERLAKECS